MVYMFEITTATATETRRLLADGAYFIFGLLVRRLFHFWSHWCGAYFIFGLAGAALIRGGDA